jgi:hypothetical protein
MALMCNASSASKPRNVGEIVSWGGRRPPALAMSTGLMRVIGLLVKPGVASVEMPRKAYRA